VVDTAKLGVTDGVIEGVAVGVGVLDGVGGHGPSLITEGSKSGHSDRHGMLPNTIQVPPKESLRHHLSPS